jgi:hypothetical protein
VGSTLGALEYEGPIHRWSLEGGVGVDPDQTELNKELEIGGEAYFGGVKGQYTYTVSEDDKNKWHLLVQTSFLSQDLDVGGYNSIQLLLGSVHFWGPVRMAVNLDGVGSTSRVDVTNRNFSESNARFEILYVF